VGAFDQSAAFLASAVAGLRRHGRLGLLPQALTHQGWTAINMLRWNVAVPAVEEAARLARETGQPLWQAAAQTGKAMLAGLRGDDQASETLTREAEAVVLPLRASAVLAGIQLTRGITALGAGRYAEAPITSCSRRAWPTSIPTRPPPSTSTTTTARRCC
jgi:hypothetical protein